MSKGTCDYMKIIERTLAFLSYNGRERVKGTICGEMCGGSCKIYCRDSSIRKYTLIEYNSEKEIKDNITIDEARIHLREINRTDDIFFILEEDLSISLRCNKIDYRLLLKLEEN